MFFLQQKWHIKFESSRTVKLANLPRTVP